MNIYDGWVPTAEDQDTNPFQEIIRKAVEDEREACAKLCESDTMLDMVQNMTWERPWYLIRREKIAAAIRARSHK